VPQIVEMKVRDITTLACSEEGRFWVFQPMTTEIEDIRTAQNLVYPLQDVHQSLIQRNFPGGLENVITVLSELSEKLDAKKLLATAKKHDDVLTTQRLGWLLESLKEKDLAKGLADWVGKRNPPMRPLEPGSPLERSKENERWRLLINAKPVPEA